MFLYPERRPLREVLSGEVPSNFKGAERCPPSKSGGADKCPMSEFSRRISAPSQ
ncbi:hypothetical protein DPMN_107413 [Dreissena polymorpha]|uniref:Uncharacterized protein n=1 Tax=Dreissena polymorpha TaxID=45954 RepID=A0A9D4K703_DREPO|nr:hypothetical protein DPMN_107413 [Dreissena polymorpha]